MGDLTEPPFNYASLIGISKNYAVKYLWFRACLKPKKYQIFKGRVETAIGR